MSVAVCAPNGKVARGSVAHVCLHSVATASADIDHHSSQSAVGKASNLLVAYGSKECGKVDVEASSEQFNLCAHLVVPAEFGLEGDGFVYIGCLANRHLVKSCLDGVNDIGGHAHLCIAVEGAVCFILDALHHFVAHGLLQ